MNLKEFGVYFAKLREESGYRSQRELADVSGVSHSTINRIESGAHKVSPDNLKILASHLKGVDYYDLMRAVGYIGSDLLKKPEYNLSFFGGPENYTEDEIEEMEAALERYRAMKRRAAEQAEKDQKK
ncbi:helix-turn-helix domain-containing protein [Paenibacillus solani]|uniref:helix-turn-helix domain-containing protein n=1 Tax=Paenibacillus solani TaxID=1705565 RepID=UPI003D2927B7